MLGGAAANRLWSSIYRREASDCGPCRRAQQARLQDTSRRFLREATLKAANTILVDYHHSLPFSRVWGDRSRSSSDGQRFAVQRDSLLSSFYPRYFGYYDRAPALYTHTSDLHSVYATQAISCAPREARYVLSGILDNDTTLVIRDNKASGSVANLREDETRDSGVLKVYAARA
jgi:TnpA family transposase